MRYRPDSNCRGAENRSKGFTLIELLVVIAIIALLMSILMPALGNVRRMAKEVICGTNVRHLVTSFHLYADDHDDRLPDMSYNPETGRHENQFIYWISSYARDMMRSRYNMQREMLYSPTNPHWDRDDFYLPPDSDIERGWSVVIGYFVFGGDERLQRTGQGHWWSFAGDAPDTTRPLFPVYLYEDPYFDFIWTDMNRQLGDGEWVTSWDAQRWGSNHLYDLNWPAGSHVGHLHGGVSWTEGEDLDHRFNARGARLFW